MRIALFSLICTVDFFVAVFSWTFSICSGAVLHPCQHVEVTDLKDTLSNTERRRAAATTKTAMTVEVVEVLVVVEEEVEAGAAAPRRREDSNADPATGLAA
jgi:hypothetical protein